MFANGPGDLGSIPGRIIPKTLKMVLDTSLLNTQQYKVRTKGKVEQSRERVAPSPTPQYSSYWKRSLLVALDYARQLYFLHLTVCKQKLYLSSSSCHTISTGIPDPLPPPVSIVHRSREVFKATSCIGTELLYIGSRWSSYLCSSMRRGPQEYVAYEFVLTSPAVSCMSGSPNFDSFREGW